MSQRFQIACFLIAAVLFAGGVLTVASLTSGKHGTNRATLARNLARTEARKKLRKILSRFARCDERVVGPPTYQFACPGGHVFTVQDGAVVIDSGLATPNPSVPQG